MKIKVCGLSIPIQILELDLNENIDYLGFIFYSKSKRFVFDIPVQTKNTKRVGVFVNENNESISRKIKQDKLDVVQLHGNESVEFCHLLKKQFSNIELIKVFGINEDFDFERTKQYERVVDLFLFDTKSDNYGGTGLQFKWEKLDEYHGNIPFFLSGGLNQGSLDKILNFRHNKFYGIDLNSGFEIEPGDKDLSRLNQFVESINNLKIESYE